jgi:hypothetical protein
MGRVSVPVVPVDAMARLEQSRRYQIGAKYRDFSADIALARLERIISSAAGRNCYRKVTIPSQISWHSSVLAPPSCVKNLPSVRC